MPGITGIGGLTGTAVPFANDVAALPSSAEFSVGGADAPAGGMPAGGVGGSFGGYLADKVAQLDTLQQGANAQSQALATGQAQDVAAVVMQVEQAALAMQLAVQVRNKAVEAYQEILHIQI